MMFKWLTINPCDDNVCLYENETIVQFYDINIQKTLKFIWSIITGGNYV